MKIRIEETVYEGSPIEIIGKMREANVRKNEFPDVDSFLEDMQKTYERMTDLPCSLPDEGTEARALAMLELLEYIGVVVVLEEE